MVVQNNVAKRKIYYQFETRNVSFRETHYFLKGQGVVNNAFFLLLFDPELANINPRDPRLNLNMKQRVLKECIHNYWYFLREVVQIPDQGGSASSGKPYKLHRGNLALNFCLVHNWNVFAEFPRQHGKTIAVVIRILWEFLFGTSNSETMIINKKHDDSKLNLQRLKDIRAVLPDYLQMAATFGVDGKRIKPKSNVETLDHPTNGNKLKTLPAARNKILANSLGRGCTQPRQWYDEYAFIPYNNIVYLSATPAFQTASQNAKNNGAPYGIIITTTPGDLTTEEGLSAYNTKDKATDFSENWYDMDLGHLQELLSKNRDSSFIYIRFTYKQLGSDETWFRQVVVNMEKNWSAIRREVLLEWAKASDNSPFNKEDLDIVGTLIKEPIKVITICSYYTFNIYENINLSSPPLVGVDVSGGFRRDSSTITVVDSTTTKVTADFNCNYISVNDLAKVIYELVTKYMSNAIVNIERNGGYGASVLSKLINTKIKKNLYYEIKDRVIEERFNGAKIIKKTQKTKVFGLDSTKSTREDLMEILDDRMNNHKDKFISPILYKELQSLEVKKNGRIEHTSNGHDDQVFAYLLAMYIWYYGTDVMDRWGLKKRTMRTDQDLEEGIMTIEEKYENIIEDIEMESDTSNMVNEQLTAIKDNTMTYEQWMQSEFQNDQLAMQDLLQTKVGRMAYVDKYKVSMDSLEDQIYTLPDKIFTNFYDRDNNDRVS